MTELARRIRRELFRMMLGIIVLDAIAIVLLVRTPVRDLRGAPRTALLLVWLLLTMWIVLGGLQRIHSARVAARRGRG